MKLTVSICPKTNDNERVIFTTEQYVPFTQTKTIIGDALLGCKVVRSLLQYKIDYYDKFYSEIREMNNDGRQEEAKAKLKQYMDEKIDFFGHYEQNLVPDDKFFVKLNKYDIDVAPMILYGYLSEINWKYYDLKVEQE